LNAGTAQATNSLTGGSHPAASTSNTAPKPADTSPLLLPSNNYSGVPPGLYEKELAEHPNDAHQYASVRQNHADSVRTLASHAGSVHVGVGVSSRSKTPYTAGRGRRRSREAAPLTTPGPHQSRSQASPLPVILDVAAQIASSKQRSGYPPRDDRDDYLAASRDYYPSRDHRMSHPRDSYPPYSAATYAMSLGSYYGAVAEDYYHPYPPTSYRYPPRPSPPDDSHIPTDELHDFDAFPSHHGNMPRRGADVSMRDASFESTRDYYDPREHRDLSDALDPRETRAAEVRQPINERLNNQAYRHGSAAAADSFRSRNQLELDESPRLNRLLPRAFERFDQRAVFEGPFATPKVAPTHRVPTMRFTRIGAAEFEEYPSVSYGNPPPYVQHRDSRMPPPPFHHGPVHPHGMPYATRASDHSFSAPPSSLPVYPVPRTRQSRKGINYLDDGEDDDDITEWMATASSRPAVDTSSIASFRDDVHSSVHVSTQPHPSVFIDERKGRQSSDFSPRDVLSHVGDAAQLLAHRGVVDPRVATLLQTLFESDDPLSRDSLRKLCSWIAEHANARIDLKYLEKEDFEQSTLPAGEHEAQEHGVDELDDDDNQDTHHTGGSPHEMEPPPTNETNAARENRCPTEDAHPRRMSDYSERFATSLNATAPGVVTPVLPSYSIEPTDIRVVDGTAGPHVKYSIPKLHRREEIDGQLYAQELSHAKDKGSSGTASASTSASRSHTPRKSTALPDEHANTEVFIPQRLANSPRFSAKTHASSVAHASAPSSAASRKSTSGSLSNISTPPHLIRSISAEELAELVELDGDSPVRFGKRTLNSMQRVRPERALPQDVHPSDESPTVKRVLQGSDVCMPRIERQHSLARIPPDSGLGGTPPPAGPTWSAHFQASPHDLDCSVANQLRRPDAQPIPVHSTSEMKVGASQEATETTTLTTTSTTSTTAAPSSAGPDAVPGAEESNAPTQTTQTTTSTTSVAEHKVSTDQQATVTASDNLPQPLYFQGQPIIPGQISLSAQAQKAAQQEARAAMLADMDTRPGGLKDPLRWRRILVGVDIGGTLSKICYFSPNNPLPEEVLRKRNLDNFILSQKSYGLTGRRSHELCVHSAAHNGVFHFLKFESARIPNFFEMIDRYNLGPVTLYATGGGAVKHEATFRAHLRRVRERVELQHRLQEERRRAFMDRLSQLRQVPRPLSSRRLSQTSSAMDDGSEDIVRMDSNEDDVRRARHGSVAEVESDSCGEEGGDDEEEIRRSDSTSDSEVIASRTIVTPSRPGSTTPGGESSRGQSKLRTRLVAAPLPDIPAVDPDSIDEGSYHIVDEMRALVRGVEFLIRHSPGECFSFKRYLFHEELEMFTREPPKFPFLLVNIGSGVSILKVESGSRYTRVGGTSLGGGTFYGLSRALTGCTSFREALALAHQGKGSKVDLLVSDIYGRDYSSLGLSGDTIAASFGKLAKPSAYEQVSREDLTKAALVMITNNICSISHLYARQVLRVPSVVFVGNFLRNNLLAMRMLSYALTYWSGGTIEAIFLKHEGYFGAIGCFVPPSPPDESETSVPSARIDGSQSAPPTDTATAASLQTQGPAPPPVSAPTSHEAPAPAPTVRDNPQGPILTQTGVASQTASTAVTPTLPPASTGGVQTSPQTNHSQLSTMTQPPSQTSTITPNQDLTTTDSQPPSCASAGALTPATISVQPHEPVVAGAEHLTHQEFPSTDLRINISDNREALDQLTTMLGYDSPNSNSQISEVGVAVQQSCVSATRFETSTTATMKRTPPVAADVDSMVSPH